MAHRRQCAGPTQLAGVEAEQKRHAGREVTVDGSVSDQSDEQDQEDRHQPAHRNLQPSDDAPRHDDYRGHHEQGVPEQHLPGVRQEVVEDPRRELAVGTHEGAATQTEHVRHGPTGDHGVVRENEEAREHTHPTDQGPETAGAAVPNQRAQRVDGTLSPGAAHQDLGNHDRDADGGDADQVDENEGAAAVLAGDVGELPDVTQSDCGTGCGEHEQQAARPHAVSRNIVRHDCPLRPTSRCPIFTRNRNLRKRGGPVAILRRWQSPQTRKGRHHRRSP